MSKKRDDRIEDSTDIEPLDLDLVSERSERRVSKGAEFLTGQDTINGFLHKRVLSDSSEYVAVSIPRAIFRVLPSGVSKWVALQEWLIKRSESMIVGRLIEDVYSLIATSEGLGFSYDSWNDTRDTLRSVYRAIHDEISANPSDYELIEENHKLEHRIKIDEEELHEERSKNEKLKTEIDKLKAELVNVGKETERLKLSISDMEKKHSQMEIERVKAELDYVRNVSKQAIADKKAFQDKYELLLSAVRESKFSVFFRKFL